MESAAAVDAAGAATWCLILSREGHLFSRIVFALGMEPNLTMKVIAFWLWLEENGHRDIVGRIHSLDHGSLLEVASVGGRFVQTLEHRLNSPQCAPGRPRFREAAIGGINFYLIGVCRKVLEHVAAQERVEEKLLDLSWMQRLRIDGAPEADVNGEMRRAALCRAWDALPAAHRSIAEDASSFLHRSVFQAARPLLAPQFDVPRDERTLFVTFSNGHPLTEEELLTFFIGNYGDVQMVQMQETNDDGKPPLYAHVTFHSLPTLLRVLNGSVKVKFMSHGKHLWARRFIPKRKIYPSCSMN